MRITVVGLGKLGSPIAALYASVGHEVVGIDISERFVELINDGRAPVNEPQLQDLITVGRSNLSATTDWSKGLKGAELSVVIVPTPSQPDGTFTNEFILHAIESIGREFRAGTTAPRHTVVIASTVMPGSMNGPIRQALEGTAGVNLGSSLGLVYSPQFIALGSVVRNLQFPDMVLVGASDHQAGDVAEAALRTVVKSDAAFQRMTLVNAEIVKLSVNTFVTTKISFANMLSELCDALEGADVDTVTRAVGSDSRVGTKYLSGGLGYGGPCFPRDNIALAALGRQLGVDATIAVATDQVNDRQVIRIVERVTGLGQSVKVVDVWGLSYKPDTEVIDASQGVQIAAELSRRGLQVRVHDPQVSPEAVRHTGAEWLENPIGASAPDVIVLATPWPQYLEWATTVRPNVAFVDPWGLAKAPENCTYLTPGRQG